MAFISDSFDDTVALLVGWHPMPMIERITTLASALIRKVALRAFAPDFPGADAQLTRNSFASQFQGQHAIGQLLTLAPNVLFVL